MKRYIWILMSAVVLFGAGACSKRKSVSDAELAQIFRDAFLSNAYISERGLNLDSLRLYEPIFNKYGYSTQDVQNAIGSFAKRKSARLSDVVEESIILLEQEGNKIDFEVSILDTLSNIARRRTTRTILSDSLLTFYKLSDTTSMNFTFERPAVGTYELHFDYYIDSLDTTKRGFSSSSHLEKSVSKMVKKMDKKRIDSEIRKSRKAGLSSEELKELREELEMDDEMVEKIDIEKYKVKKSILTRGVINSLHSMIDVDDEAERLVVKLAVPNGEDGKPHLTIKRMTLKQIPPKDFAEDSLYRSLLDIKIYDDELLFPKAANSL